MTDLYAEALATFATLFDEAGAAGEPDRTAMVVATAGLAVIGTTALATFAAGHAGSMGGSSRVLTVLGSVAINAAVFVFAFRVAADGGVDVTIDPVWGRPAQAAMAVAGRWGEMMARQRAELMGPAKVLSRPRRSERRR